MRSHDEDTTRPSAQAFTPEYLELLDQRDEPGTGAEAETAGPWSLAPHPRGHAVLRAGESLDLGDRPAAVFTNPDSARLAAAVLPGTGREPRYRLGKEPDAHGYPVWLDGELAGHLALFDENLIAALNVADGLVRSPFHLAWLLDGAGGLALRYAGRLAAVRARGG
jgi:hypothetical protein